MGTTGKSPVSSEEKESLLWREFLLGNKNAFEQLYRSYFRVMASYGSRLNSDIQMIENAIQDVFVDLWRRREFLSETDNPKFYLFRALKNQLLRNARKDIYETSTEIDNFLDYLITLSPEEQTIEGEDKSKQTQQWQSAISSLSARQREVINLRFYHGLTLEETSSIMGLSKQGVSNLLSRSYAMLRTSAKFFCTLLFMLAVC